MVSMPVHHALDRGSAPRLGDKIKFQAACLIWQGTRIGKHLVYIVKTIRSRCSSVFVWKLYKYVHQRCKHQGILLLQFFHNDIMVLFCVTINFYVLFGDVFICDGSDDIINAPELHQV